MAGLSAVFSPNGDRADDALVRRMGQAVAHRGEHAVGHHRGAVALEYRGVDPGQASRQLASTEIPEASVVLTGQLYNRDELAQALRLPSTAGVTDADVILAAYRKWGADFVARLDGDFAFALHDAVNRCLFCARDPIGTLPLFHSTLGGSFLAASEPKQMLAVGVSSTPCEVAIADFLAGERHLIGGERSYFEAIHRLEPAHYLVADRDGVRVRRYWQLDPSHRIEERNENELVERVRYLIRDSVTRRLPAVGPYGSALSGGLDSSSVTGLMRNALDARGVSDPIESFSFELRDPAADEPELIEAVARAFRTNHHRIFLDQDNVFDVLPAFSRACDQPAINMGLLYMWRKKQKARDRGVRVVLSGLGGDELFYGAYQHFADLLRRLRLIALWREMRGVYPINKTTGLRTPKSKLLVYALMPMVPRAVKQWVRRMRHGEHMGRPWVREDLARRVNLGQRIRAGAPKQFRDLYRQGCYEVFQYALVNGTLPLHESLGAALGVETRFPLLDRRLVEYMFAVPREHKILEGNTRMLQRRAMEGILPEVVVKSHIKKNMNPVFTRQQRAHFKAEVEKVCGRPSLRCEQYFDAKEIRKARDRFMSDQDDEVTQFVLWRVLALEDWLGNLS